MGPRNGSTPVQLELGQPATCLRLATRAIPAVKGDAGLGKAACLGCLDHGAEMIILAVLVMWLAIDAPVQRRCRPPSVHSTVTRLMPHTTRRCLLDHCRWNSAIWPLRACPALSHHDQNAPGERDLGARFLPQLVRIGLQPIQQAGNRIVRGCMPHARAAPAPLPYARRCAGWRSGNRCSP